MNETLRQRLDDLLVDRATGGLDRKDALELEGMLSVLPDSEADRMDLATAAFDLSLSEDLNEELPKELRGRIANDAQHFYQSYNQLKPIAEDAGPSVVPFAAKSQDGSSGTPDAAPMLAWSGWLAAAAILVFSILTTWQPKEPDPPAIAREKLIASPNNYVSWDWTTTEDPAGLSAQGDVVFSMDRQEGYMRIQGLKVNDPSKEVYQLWIFDQTRNTTYPVDGGVFSISEGDGGEIIVPIDSKLLVRQPNLFAITVEEPGGVVVSGRERIVLLAQPPKG
jgi:hypothetical protein